MNTNIEAEMERLRQQALWGWDKELRNLGWFGLRDGMSFLEVGSGPGFITAQLLDTFPKLHVTGVEIDPEMVGRSEKYLADKHSGRYKIVESSVMEMPLRDDTFDFAYARLVFQHLPDPLGALREIRRVLKPGGKLAIMDIDDGLNTLVDPPSPEADRIIKRLSEFQAELGGNRFIGRRLWRLLAEAGFTGMDLEMFAIHSDELGIEIIAPQTWDDGAWEPLVQKGAVTREEVDIMHREHDKFIASPEKYALLLGWMVAGTA
jgi:ubiquinone/menaquinone biosynthesis C-methylase UbiE